MLRTTLSSEAAVFTAASGATLTCRVPFPPLVRGGSVEIDGFAVSEVLEHVARDRRVGVVLVRRGGHAAGIFDGDALVASKVGSRYVQGRTKKGGSSQGRYQRRRGNQAAAAWSEAADVAARIVLPEAASLDAVVVGGDREGIAALREDPRLRVLMQRAEPRVVDVPDPRLAVLRTTPEQFRACVMEVRQVETD